MDVGTKVEVRFSKSRRLSGTIASINDDKTCDVDLDCGEKEKEVPLVLIRNIESVVKEDVVALSKNESSENKISSSNDVQLNIGDRVEAKFRGRGSRYYPGIIKNVTVTGDKYKYDIDYDDGDRDRKISAQHIRKLDSSAVEQQRRRRVKSVTTNSADAAKASVVATANGDDSDDSAPTKAVFSKGQRVAARYRGRGKRWYNGTIAECFESKNEYSIQYDDGDRDRSLAAEFIRPIDNTSEALQENTTAAVRDIRSNSDNLEIALTSEEENKIQAKGHANDTISTAIDDGTKKLEETAVELVESQTEEDVVKAPDNICAIVTPHAVDGDVSFVVDSGDKTKKESSTRDEVPGDRTKHQDVQSTKNYYSGKGNRLYRGKVVRVKTIHLYEIEYPDSTGDTNIPFGALRLPQGYKESDIKIGTLVDVLSWQDRFAAVL
eukprot:scaffold2550_cov153-Skeletonema_menzelii.AAC.2